MILLKDKNSKHQNNLLETSIVEIPKEYFKKMMLANEIITQLEDNNFWLKTDKVIENCQNQKTLFFAYSALQKGIKQKWALLNTEQKQGMRFYIETLLTQQLEIKDISQRNDNLLRKINSILVEIIKKELNGSWPTALSDLAQISYKSQNYCQNILLIFKELSVEVFDFWENSLTQQEFQNLNTKLQEGFKAIYDVFIFVLQSYLSNDQQINNSLVYTCLQTLEVYCSWIPIGFIIMEPLPQYLTQMVAKKQFVHMTLKCIEQIFNVKLVNGPTQLSQQDLAKCQKDFFNFYTQFLQKFQEVYNSKTNFEFARNQIISQSDNTAILNQFDILCQNLSLTINAFFQTHLDWIIKLNYGNSNNQGVLYSLSVGVEYMAQLTTSGDNSTLKTCVEFFLFFTEYFRKIHNNLNSQSGFQQNQNIGLINMMKKLIQEGPINTAIYNLTLKMPQPQEIQIEIDDDGIPKKQTFVNTSKSSFYNTMKKIFQNFALLNWNNFQTILNERIQKQTNNSEFSYEYLNSLCWTIGCLAHQIKGENEKTFFITVLRTLLNYIKNKNNMNDKCVIATNIMHIVSQYHNFLKQNLEFNRIVVGKLFEFMREKIPGVPEMSCSVFLKLCKSNSSAFRQDVVIDKTNNNFNFVFENYKQQVLHLNDQLLIQEFYDALGIIIAAQKTENLKNEIINEIMSEYTKVIINAQQNLQNQNYLSDLTNTQHLNFALKINHLISQHTKESYFTYFNNTFPNITNLYEAYLGIINQIFQQEGQTCLNQVSVKSYRKVRTNILILIENLVKNVNQQNQPQFLQIYQKLIYFSLELYTKEDPLIREPQILSFIGVCLEKFRGQMFDDFAKMVPIMLQSVLPMITKDFHSYPEHRENFFKLIQTLVRHCFQIFSHIDQQSFILIMDCIIWAIKHDLPSTYELGLKTLNSLVREINKNQNMVDSFYQKFYMNILNDLFYIWTDGLHQNGTQLIAESMFLMFNVLDNLQINLFENQNENNKIAVYNHVYNIMSENFSNLSKKDHSKYLTAIFEASTKSSKILEQNLNDYAVSLKIFTLDQLIKN